MLLMTDSFGIRNALINVFLSLDSIIYSLISYLFQVFNYLASAEIFSSDVFQELTYRVYIIVGVAALFLIAFSLLQSLVNPDDITKGKIRQLK